MKKLFAKGTGRCLYVGLRNSIELEIFITNGLPKYNFLYVGQKLCAVLIAD